MKRELDAREMLLLERKRAHWKDQIETQWERRKAVRYALDRLRAERKSTPVWEFEERRDEANVLLHEMEDAVAQMLADAVLHYDLSLSGLLRACIGQTGGSVVRRINEIAKDYIERGATQKLVQPVTAPEWVKNGSVETTRFRDEFQKLEALIQCRRKILLYRAEHGVRRTPYENEFDELLADVVGPYKITHVARYLGVNARSWLSQRHKHATNTYPYGRGREWDYERDEYTPLTQAKKNTEVDEWYD